MADSAAAKVAVFVLRLSSISHSVAVAEPTQFNVSDAV